MNIGRILFLAIFLFSTSTVLATSSLLEVMVNDAASDKYLSTVSEGDAVRLQLRNQYKKDLMAILNQMEGDNISYTELEDKLLSLKVPDEFKDLHFKLISSVDELNSDKSLKAAQNRLEELSSNYAWLAANISFIIANSF